MTKEQMCIKELFNLLDYITEKAKKHDLSLLQPHGVSGADAYQGLPLICRITDDIEEKYHDVLRNAFRESEADKITN